MAKRFITIWRKPPPDILDWDFYISESVDELENVVANLRKRDVRQFKSYRLGEHPIEAFSEPFLDGGEHAG